MGGDKPCNKSRTEPSHGSRERACLCLAFPSDCKGCWEDGATYQQAHDEKQPAQVDADKIPDAGEKSHHQTPNADHDVCDGDELLGCGRRFDVSLEDVEGLIMILKSVLLF